MQTLSAPPLPPTVTQGQGDRDHRPVQERHHRRLAPPEPPVLGLPQNRRLRAVAQVAQRQEGPRRHREPPHVEHSVGARPGARPKMGCAGCFFVIVAPLRSGLTTKRRMLLLLLRWLGDDDVRQPFFASLRRSYMQGRRGSWSNSTTKTGSGSGSSGAGPSSGAFRTTCARCSSSSSTAPSAKARTVVGSGLHRLCRSHLFPLSPVVVPYVAEQE